MHLLLISDFNITNLQTQLSKQYIDPDVRVSVAPFGQVAEVILNAGHAVWAEPVEAAVIWSRPERVSQSYARALEGEEFSHSNLREEVARYADMVRALVDRCATVLHPTWVTTTYNRGGGPLTLQHGVGLSAALMEMNLQLRKSLATSWPGLILDAQLWMNAAKQSPHAEKLWYLTKIPFQNDVFAAAAKDIVSTLDAVRGRTKKLVVVDLDNTLWGGVIGEDGPAGIRLGGHDPIGEAYQDFQRHLKALARQGIVLAIASKNEEDIALETIRSHPEMILRESDFAAWRINWKDKAANIESLAHEINLGLDSIVFLDDSRFERERVRQALPQVLVPELPASPMEYGRVLQGIRELDRIRVTSEDRKRGQMYVSERRRRRERSVVTDINDWIRTLEITIRIEGLKPENVARVVQLLNKTNQMNLSVRRMSEAEFQAWSQHDEHHVWSVRVQDRFGDYGLAGVVSVANGLRKSRIVDFCLSCRVLGRLVEFAILSFLSKFSRDTLQADWMEAEFVPQERNAPSLQFLETSGMQRKGHTNRYVWSLAEPYPMPDGLSVTVS